MTFISKTPPDNSQTPSRQEIDNMLKRMALLRRQALSMSPEAPLRDKLLMQARIKEALEELTDAQAAVQGRLAIVQERRAAAQAYLRSHGLRLVSR